MKKYILSLCFLFGTVAAPHSLSGISSATATTQIEIKNAYKGMFTIVTYNSEGTFSAAAIVFSLIGMIKSNRTEF